MTERLRPLTVTTTTHAFALVMYWAQVVLGLAYLTGAAEALAMTDLFGRTAVTVWAMVLFLSGVVCAVAAHATARERNPVRGLQVEYWAVLVLGLASAFYEATLLVGNGFGVVTTQVYATSVALGAGLRARQIAVERRQVVAALSALVLATPAPLAEPPSGKG